MLPEALFHTTQKSVTQDPISHLHIEWEISHTHCKEFMHTSGEFPHTPLMGQLKSIKMKECNNTLMND